ncbi:MAG: (d)CMP kinase [Firmicutes bacterium]|nr:(d)CMP kinase [Bacillota bacterium]
MGEHIHIAIDGPSSAGKSTIANYLAGMLNIPYLDTGAMYRAVALALRDKEFCLNQKNVEARLLVFLKRVDLQVFLQAGLSARQRVLLNGEEVTDKLRTPELATLASNISAYKSVRDFLVALQQSIALNSDIILDGRDIGTVVLPDAKLKIFLTASLEVRAIRRYNEFIERGIDTTLEEVKQQIATRDNNDSTRKHAPLKKADDAFELDTTDLSIEETAQVIYAKAKIFNII